MSESINSVPLPSFAWRMGLTGWIYCAAKKDVGEYVKKRDEQEGDAIARLQSKHDDAIATLKREHDAFNGSKDKHQKEQLEQLRKDIAVLQAEKRPRSDLDSQESKKRRLQKTLVDAVEMA